VRLEQNYRSTQTILQAANGVIAHNSGRLGKELWTAGESGEPVQLYAGFNEQDEARFIVEQLEAGSTRRPPAALRGHPVPLQCPVPGARGGTAARGVPYRIYGGQRFYERLEIRNAMAYLRLLVSRGDDAAIERVINTPPRGIGSKTIDTLRETAASASARCGRPCACAGSTSSCRPGPSRRWRASGAHRRDGHGDRPDDPGGTGGCQVVRRSGLIEYHRNEKGEKGLARVENLEELVSAARSFHTRG
jgi:DNA helicase-2/ATP-dependent DNA helicase PcrA